MACVFRHLKTGHSYIFQNNELSDPKTPIINLSRSGIMNYRWTVYFKRTMTNQLLTEFGAECQIKIETFRKEKLRSLPVTSTAWKTWKSVQRNIVLKSHKLDDYGRKIVNIEMGYHQFSWEVNSVCFNLLTEIMNEDKFKDSTCDLLVIPFIATKRHS
eukprot:190826_1